MKVDLGLSVSAIKEKCYLVLDDTVYIRISKRQFKQIAKALGFELFVNKKNSKD